ncbi:MAG: lysostaphin resistance A-like protein [Candidatus Thorarchaeota archaeon]
MFAVEGEFVFSTVVLITNNCPSYVLAVAMTEENEESTRAPKWFTIPHTQVERNATLLWGIVTVGVVIVAGFVGFELAGTFASFAPGATLVLLVTIPIMLYLIPQSETGSPQINRRMTIIVLCWFLSTVLVVPILGFNLSSVLLALAFFALGFIGPLLYLRYNQGLTLSSLGFWFDTKRNILASLGVTIVYGLLVFVQFGFREWMGFISLVDFEPGIDPFALLPLAFVFGAFFTLIAAALPEELVFRTVLQSHFAEHRGRVMGILLASLVFGLFHFYVNTLLYQTFYASNLTSSVLMSALVHAFIYQAQAGLIFGVAWERTRNLLLPVMLHTVHNALEMLPYYLGVMLGLFF